MSVLAALAIVVLGAMLVALLYLIGGLAYKNGYRDGAEDSSRAWREKGHSDLCAQFKTSCYPNPTTLCDCEHKREDHVRRSIEGDEGCVRCLCEGFTHG